MIPGNNWHRLDVVLTALPKASPTKLDIVLAIIALSGAAGFADTVLEQLRLAPQWILGWSLPVDKQRILFRALLTALRATRKTCVLWNGGVDMNAIM